MILLRFFIRTFTRVSFFDLQILRAWIAGHSRMILHENPHFKWLHNKYISISKKYGIFPTTHKCNIQRWWIISPEIYHTIIFYETVIVSDIESIMGSNTFLSYISRYTILSWIFYCSMNSVGNIFIPAITTWYFFTAYTKGWEKWKKLISCIGVGSELKN